MRDMNEFKETVTFIGLCIVFLFLSCFGLISLVMLFLEPEHETTEQIKPSHFSVTFPIDCDADLKYRGLSKSQEGTVLERVEGNTQYLKVVCRSKISY